MSYDDDDDDDSKRFQKDNHGNVQHIPFLPDREIPTIHKLLHDPALLNVFLLCLSAYPNISSQSKIAASDTSNQYETSVMGNLAKISGPGGSAIHADVMGNVDSSGSRKRSMSLSVETSAMNVKMNVLGTSPKLNSALRSTMNATGSHINKPTFNSQVLAATIIYSVLQYYDHWPTPVVQIYADDCFGPRLWVDNKLCQLFVLNLNLSHADPVKNDSEIEDVDLADAARMADTYRDYWVETSDNDGTFEKSIPATSSSKVGPTFASFLSTLSHSSSWRKNNKVGEHHVAKRQRTGPRTVGSTMSHDSESEDDSSTTVPSNANIAVLYNDAASDVEDTGLNSGEKRRRLERSIASRNGTEVEMLDNDNQSITDHGRAASRDLQADVPLSRESEIESRVVSNHKYRYPVTQKYLRMGSVRNRYHGENMKAAHYAIVMSLSKRLDTKSKQNSSLLQCLPSFMEISGVRKLVAASLEKWLQSPALAGLARSLFICTVNHIATVDPPLTDDLHVISSIVGMTLKSNQVRRRIFHEPDIYSPTFAYTWIVDPLHLTVECSHRKYSCNSKKAPVYLCDHSLVFNADKSTHGT